MKMKKVIYRQSTSGNEKVFLSSMKSLGKVYGKKACSMIRSDGNTSFLVQYNKYNNANKNFYKLLQTKCNKPEINLIISGNVREK